MCNSICNIFNACTGFEIQALCIGKNLRKNPEQQEKKSKKIQEHCVQNSLFQGFYKYKKTQRSIQGNQRIQVRLAIP